MARYVIVGGVAGGATTAARLRRIDEKSEIILFERGPYISYANCGLPYYIGQTIKEWDNLFVQTPESFSNRFNVEVKVNHEVTAIDPVNKKVNYKNLLTGETSSIFYDKLVLSPGADPFKPPLPGIDDPRIFTLRNPKDTLDIKNYIENQNHLLKEKNIDLKYFENEDFLIKKIEMYNKCKELDSSESKY